MLAVAAGAATRHGGFSPRCVDAAASYHVALIVEHADAESNVRVCVAVGTPSETAQQVLQDGGVPYGFVDEGSNGRAVCQLHQEPATPAGGWTQANCFSGAGSNVGKTWSIFCTSPWQHAPDGSANQCYSSDGSWRYSSHGISSLQLRDGDAVGFKYESGPGRPGSLAGICPTVAGDRPPPTVVGGPPVHSPSPAPGTRTGATRPVPGSQAPGALLPATSQSPAGSPAATAAAAPPTASPDVEVQAVGAGAGPGAPAHPSTPRTSPGGGRWVGPVAAVTAGLLLLGGLMAQLILPRVRP